MQQPSCGWIDRKCRLDVLEVRECIRSRFIRRTADTDPVRDDLIRVAHLVSIKRCSLQLHLREHGAGKSPSAGEPAKGKTFKRQKIVRPNRQQSCNIINYESPRRRELSADFHAQRGNALETVPKQIAILCEIVAT
jgi:hypothetical protein